MMTRISPIVLTLSAALAGSIGAQTATVPTTSPLPAASSVKTAAAAAALLRRLYFVGQQNDAVALGDSLVKRFPLDSRVRAWHLASVANLGYSARADSLTAKIDTLSRDPWLLAARAFARHNPPRASRAAAAQGIRLAKRARSLAPKEPDFVWLVAEMMLSIPGYPISNSIETLAFLDSAGPRVRSTSELKVMHATVLAFASNPFNPATLGSSQPDTSKLNAALRAYGDIRAVDSLSYGARLEAAYRLRVTGEVQGLELAREAVALSPRSPNARQAYWAMINGQRGKTAAEKQAAVAADRAEFLAVTDSAPWALATAWMSTRSIAGREPVAATYEDRILAKAPRSRWAEEILVSRVNQWRDSLYAARDSARPGPKSDSFVVRKRYLDAMEAFLAKGWTANTQSAELAASGMFFEVREDTTYPVDKLVALVKHLTANPTGAPSFRYGEAARALANRKVELKVAESLAREGLKRTAAYLNEFPGYFFSSLGEKADALDGANASLRQQLGWTHFAAGRLVQADTELTRALDLTKKNANIYYDLGRVRAAQGRDDEAELLYAQGMTIRVRGVNPNRKELERLYQKKNGSIEGWEKYITALEEKERTTRREKILAKRDTVAKLAPSFKLADLSGKVINSDSTRGQYLVVNFWGMWCGPCVAEMPELQQFYEKYRNDKTVSILTISNDKDLAELREWMAKRKLTIPTLFDDGYVGKTARVSAFPTTWFIDKDGKVQFTAIGNTGALVEEWSWRLEATKAGPVIQP
jgi:thiol-disulfide isomerase/thioredoxin